MNPNTFTSHIYAQPNCGREVIHVAEVPAGKAPSLTDEYRLRTPSWHFFHLSYPHEYKKNSKHAQKSPVQSYHKGRSRPPNVDWVRADLEAEPKIEGDIRDHADRPSGASEETKPIESVGDPILGVPIDQLSSIDP